MISTVLRRSVLSASRRTQSLTSVSAALFHHLSHSAAAVNTVSDLYANVPPSQTRNPFGVKARDFHFQSEFRASMVSPAGSDGRDSETVGSSSDGLAISELGISPEIVKALSGRGIDKLFPTQKAVLEPAMQGRDMIGRAKHGRLEESTSSKIKGTRICIAIRSFDNPEKEAWCLPPHSRYAAMPDTRTLYTVLRSPHVDKKSREQFEMRFKKRFLVIKAQSHELSKKLFWLKRYRILGAQYELQFHCKTRLDMAPVLGKERDSF